MFFPLVQYHHRRARPPLSMQACGAAAGMQARACGRGRAAAAARLLLAAGAGSVVAITAVVRRPLLGRLLLRGGRLVRGGGCGAGACCHSRRLGALRRLRGSAGSRRGGGLGLRKRGAEQGEGRRRRWQGVQPCRHRPARRRRRESERAHGGAADRPGRPPSSCCEPRTAAQERMHPPPGPARTRRRCLAPLAWPISVSWLVHATAQMLQRQGGREVRNCRPVASASPPPPPPACWLPPPPPPPAL